tara:strand:+ start:306 stop:1202 length:897 start_codon:yes stop_codon:yes gene_type:complete
MNDVLVSVIIPIYNAEDHLEKSVESILNQEFKNFEIILINDGSTDRSKEICKKYKLKDNRVIYLETEHQGLTGALIKALEVARGKFIARQDADDFSHQQRLKKQLNWFQTKKGRVLCGSNCNIINEKGKLRKNWSIKYSHKNIVNRLNYTNCFVHSSVMFLREAAKRVGGYEISQKYSQDYDLWWKLTTQGEVGNLKDKMVTIRERFSSISIKNKNNQTEDFLKSATKFFKYRLENKKFNKFNKLNTQEFNELLRFFYNDKLEYKIKFKDLNLKQIILFISNPYMIFRKSIKLLRGSL